MRLHRIFRGCVVSIPLALFTASCAAFAQGSLKCRPADATSANLIGQLQNWVTTTDPEDIAARDTIFHVPVVPVSQITAVTDEKVCTKIIQAYAAMPGGYTPLSIYAIKMGSKYYVGYDPNRKAGEYSIVHIFDSKYAPIGGWTGG